MQQEKQKKSTEAKLYCKINLKIDIAVRAFSNLPLPPLVLQLTTLIQQIDIQKVKYLLHMYFEICFIPTMQWIHRIGYIYCY